ncbi:hypothetical protein ACV1WV_06830 [Serratia marcescens]
MTLTTEQLRARAKFWREKAVEAKWESVSIAQDMLLNADSFDELAANREAQPVGFYTTVSGRKGVVWHNGAPEDDTAIYTIPSAVAAELDYNRRRIAELEDMLDAPPAPAVPPEASPDDIPQEHNINKYSGITWAAAWNACRAAMLQNSASVNQPVSGGYKLVPAEATEDMIAAAMNCDDVSFNADETFCVNFGNIYAAMLAAAPESVNGA